MMPFLLADAMVTALRELDISRGWAILLVIGIFLGGLFNIPVYRRSRAEVVDYRPFSLYGIDRLAPRLIEQRPEQVIALNLGGCVIPLSIVVFELLRLARIDVSALYAVLGATGVTAAVSYLLARPVGGLGILLPALVPGVLAAVLANYLADAHVPVVAFCAGVLGPLIGADLLHLGKVTRRSAGLLSIGGAGSFDGIVISGFVATLLST
jgi:uncharacterized membrane protein